MLPRRCILFLLSSYRRGAGADRAQYQSCLCQVWGLFLLCIVGSRQPPTARLLLCGLGPRVEQLLGLVLLAVRQPGGLWRTMLPDSGAAELGPSLPCFDFLGDKEEFPE